MASNIAQSDSTETLSISEKLKQKAFIPNQLPQDFLRIVLDQNQLRENNDKILAQNYHMAQFANNRQMIRLNNPTQTIPVRGKLQIDIIEARLAKNYGFTKMDPYVRIKVAGKIYETPTDQNGSKNPKWGKTINCFLPNNVDMLIFEIYDEKSFTEDELIAFVKYPLPDSLFEGLFLDEWIPLSGRSGELKEGHLNIQMLFTPLSSQSINNLNPLNSISSLPLNNSLVNQNSRSSISTESNIGLDTNKTIVDLSKTYTQADLDSIKEMFPSFDSDVIKSILESNGGNKEITIEALLQISQD